MQECCTCGSVRGALGNQRPYRDTFPICRQNKPGVDHANAPEPESSCSLTPKSTTLIFNGP
jgi:hypothetical protein